MGDRVEVDVAHFSRDERAGEDFDVDAELVFETVQDELPPLIEKIERILGR